MSKGRRRHVTERQADVIMFVLLMLACVGIFAAVRWAVAFFAAILAGAWCA